MEYRSQEGQQRNFCPKDISVVTMSNFSGYLQSSEEISVPMTGGAPALLQASESQHHCEKAEIFFLLAAALRILISKELLLAPSFQHRLQSKRM